MNYIPHFVRTFATKAQAEATFYPELEFVFVYFDRYLREFRWGICPIIELRSVNKLPQFSKVTYVGQAKTS
jgi:hypothetical protein